MVVDFDGRILAQASPGPGERIVVAPVDVTRAAPRARDAPRPPHARAPAHARRTRSTAAHVYPPRGPQRSALLRGEQRAHRRGEEEPRVIASRPVVRPRMRRSPHRSRRLLAPRRGARPAVAAALRAASRAAPASPSAAGSWEGWAKLTNDWPGADLPLRGQAGTPVGAARAERRGGGRRARSPSTCRPSRARAARRCASATRSPRLSQGPGTRLVHRLGRQRVDARAARERRAAPGPARLAAGRARRSRSPRASRARRPAPADAAERRGAAARGGEAAAARSGAPRRRDAAPAVAGVGKHAGNLGRDHRRQRRRPRPALRREQARQGQLREPGVRHLLAARVHRGRPQQRPVLLRGQRRVRRARAARRPAGAPLGAPCDGKSVPCQATLSCNSGICEDRDGRCPY